MVLNKLHEVQDRLRREKIDGWLLYDFRGSNPLALRAVELKPTLLTRRWFLWVPAKGKPAVLVHGIERGSFPDLGIEVLSYTGRTSLVNQLKAMLHDAKRIAMEYSPFGNIPYISKVDAGTVDLIRSLGKEIVSSGDLLQLFLVWTPGQLQAHYRAARALAEVKDATLDFLRERVAEGRPVSEYETQSFMAQRFADLEMVFDHPPIVAFGETTSDPHYVPDPYHSRLLQPGEPILLDLWCRAAEPDGVYADITWMAHYGPPSSAFQDAFNAVIAARERGVTVIRQAFARNEPIQGWEVDRVVRNTIVEAGYERGLLHRTGHSLGTESAHGEAVHLDDFETRDERTLIPGIAVTIEPGIYLPEFGVRSEIDVYIGPTGPEVTTAQQYKLDILGT